MRAVTCCSKPPVAGREGVSRPLSTSWRKFCAAGSDLWRVEVGQLGEISWLLVREVGERYI